MRDDGTASGSRTVRELGGEIWAELSRRIPNDELDWQTKNQVVDLIMAVLARHIECTIRNYPDLPVAPLPVDFNGNVELAPMTKTEQSPIRDDEAIKLLSSALDEFGRDGKVTTIRCDVCKSLIQIRAISDAAYFADCNCGKFRGALRGI